MSNWINPAAKCQVAKVAPGVYPPQSIGVPGWTPGWKHEPSYLQAGYDGIEVHAQGAIFNAAGLPESALFVGSSAKLVRIIGATFVGGGTACAQLGIDCGDTWDKKEHLVEFEACNFVAPEVLGLAGDCPKWGVISHQTSRNFVGCKWLLPPRPGQYTEHANYAHAAPLSYYIDCEVLVCGAEAFKNVNRPEHKGAKEGIYTPDAKLLIKNCKATGWGAAGYMGGGLVVQGAAQTWIVVEDSRIYPNDASKVSGLVVGMDDGGGEHFNVETGEIGTGTPNGHVIMRNSLFAAREHPGGKLSAFRIAGALSVDIERCAITGGKNQYATIGGVAGKLHVAYCNTPEGLAFAAKKVPTSGDIVLQEAGKMLSEVAL